MREAPVAEGLVGDVPAKPRAGLADLKNLWHEKL